MKARVGSTAPPGAGSVDRTEPFGYPYSRNRAMAAAMIRRLSMCRYRCFAVLAAALWLAGCSASQDLSLADAGVSHFREQMAAQQFQQVYSEGADELKKTTTEQTMVQLLAAVARKLGAVKSANRTSWSVNFNTSGTSATLKYKTEFERGTGEETFMFRISGGKALLAGYHINSNELIIN
jgi:hypothetical protein